jgi:hypothetical protein
LEEATPHFSSAAMKQTLRAVFNAGMPQPIDG